MTSWLLALALLGPARALAAPDEGGTPCGSPVCHGSTTPWSGAGPRLNEFAVFREEDAHRRSRDVFLGERARLIARRLGGEPAERRADCVACHADPGRPEADISCATCHGRGAWETEHSKPGGSHRANVEAGLYPTDDPRRRAELCTRCHVGGEPPAVVDHRLLAAGHPRLVFDLDSFSTLQPAHHRSRAARGKQRSPAAKLWAAGQGVGLVRRLESAAREPADPDWPDPARFDCVSCHHPIRPVVAGGRPAPTLGLPRDDVGALVAYGAALTVIAPAEALALRRAAEDAAGPAILAERVEGTLDAVTTWQPDPPALPALLDALAAAGADGPPPAYSTAEQLFYGIQATLVTIKKKDALDDRRRRRVRARVRRLFEHVAARDRYDAAAFQAELRAIRAALG
jgi:hypothetical protein